MSYSIKAASPAINPATWHPVARHHQPTSGAGIVLQWFGTFLGKTVSSIIDEIRAYRRRKLDRAAVEHMLGLEDYMLRDIGLTRADVEWANRLPLSVNAATELELKAMINRKEWKR